MALKGWWCQPGSFSVQELHLRIQVEIQVHLQHPTAVRSAEGLCEAAKLAQKFPLSSFSGPGMDGMFPETWLRGPG